MADVFISYAQPDTMHAEQLAQELGKRGASVFFDRDTLVAGTDFRREIAQALEHATVVVVLLSANTRRTSWVQEELSSVLERAGGPAVVPILLDSHAKENWVWPLVSDRLGFDLSDGRTPIEVVAQKIAALAAGGEPPIAAPAHTFGRRGYLVTAFLVTMLAIGAVFFLPLSRISNQSGIGTPGIEHWLPLLTGALGVLVGYLFNKWRK